MMEIKNKMRRGASLLMAAVMTMTAGKTAFAEAGKPICDETMYVTMDPYGTITDTSVVKSYDLHGSKRIVDYGTYTKITNMTDYTTPQVDGNQVVFELSEEPEHDRFYFEGTLDAETVKGQLPWDISVRYRLNGVDKNLTELSHEKGMIEIFIDVVPNKNISDYYRNNMSLEVAAIVDMDKNLSVEAPGAQIQSMGNQKAVLFMAFPGEEQNFEIRIGTDDFEFSGLVFMMVPITLGQLDRLADLREARDTVKDSADAVSDSLDVVLDSLEGMTGGLSSTVDGLKKLEDSRRIISNAKDGIYVDADSALAVLKELSERGVPFTGYVQEAQNALEDANREINSMNDTLNSLDGYLESLGWALKNMVRDLDGTIDFLSDTRHDMGQIESYLSDLRGDLKQVSDYKDDITAETQKLRALQAQLKALLEEIKAHQKVLGITPEQMQKLLEILEELTGEDLTQEQIIMIMSYSNAIENAVNEGAGSAVAVKGISAIIKMIDGIIDGAEKPNQIDALLSSAQGSLSSLQDFAERYHEDGEEIENLLGDIADLCDTLRRTSDVGRGLIENVNDLNDTMNQYHPTAKNALQDAGLLIDSAVRGTDAMYLLMQDVETNLKKAGKPLDAGTKATLNGLSDALTEAIDGLSQVDTIRDAKKTVEDLADEKWEEYTGEDMTILNADSKAEKISFTSSENPAPQSLQIILRTEGTKEIEDDMEVTVDENFHAEGNIFQRIWSIFVRIVETIKGIFQ